MSTDSAYSVEASDCLETEAVLKYSRLKEILLDLPLAALAFSGGVDSTFLLAAWHDTWKAQASKHETALSVHPRILACTINSPLLPTGELIKTRSLVQQIGAEYREIFVDPLQESFMTDNPPDRCYHCKKIMFSKLLAVAAEENLPVLIDGTNADDEGDYRPGHRALIELGVRSPLAEVGMKKNHIRWLSRNLHLPTWQQPSMACLASRIPYGTPINEDNLRQVDAAEKVLRDLGFIAVRVRHHGDIARIETAGSPLDLLQSGAKEEVIQAFKDLGFRYITIDMEGYRTGSLNPL